MREFTDQQGMADHAPRFDGPVADVTAAGLTRTALFHNDRGDHLAALSFELVGGANDGKGLTVVLRMDQARSVHEQFARILEILESKGG